MSRFQRFSNWLLTEPGRKVVYYSWGTLTAGVMLGHALPQTIFLENYVDFLRLYKHGFAEKVTDKLQKRFEKTIELLEIDKRDRHLFRPFAANGFDIVSCGSAYSKYGVRIGLPANFFYENEKSIDKPTIKLRDASIVWDLDEGKLLAESLVLSENAQMYAIAREIKYRESPKWIFDTLIATGGVMLTYGTARSLNEKFQMYLRPKGFRIFMYCLIVAFTFGNYALTKDVLQVYYENKIDKELKEKSPVFAQGGKEFYTKVIKRNIALRKLLGKEGESVYTALGNENYLLRYKHVPLVDRKMFFEDAL